VSVEADKRVRIGVLVRLVPPFSVGAEKQGVVASLSIVAD